MVDVTPADGDDAARMNPYASRDGERVTYHKRGGSWIVVSGFRGEDRIFYRKAMLAVRILAGTRSNSNTRRRRSARTTGS